MYLRKALEFDLLKALICASDMPSEDVQAASPMRKLCDLYPDTSKSQKQSELGNILVKKVEKLEKGPVCKKMDQEKFPLKLSMAMQVG